jgi:hypothetical protein
MCQCQPKCVKCCKAATIYRSTLHVLHGRPQPQHSWPWEHRTPGTNSGSWVVTNDAVAEKLVPNFTPLSFSTTPFLAEALVPPNLNAQLKDLRNGSNLVKDQPKSVCKSLDFNPNVSMFQTDQDPYYAAQSGDNYKGIIIAKPEQKLMKKIPLMSLTLTREKKRRTRNKTRKVKRKIAEDLRLLLNEKKTKIK